MSDSYTKLMRSLPASTICTEPLATRWLWVVMLSQADANGRVYGSVPGLARIANISLEECEVALARFQAPDQYSRTQDFEGRRIRLIDGGWELINHAKYSKTRSAEERNAYMAKLMADKRAREKEQQMLADVSSVLANVSSVSNVSGELSKLAELAPSSSAVSPASSVKEKKISAKKLPAATRPDDVSEKVWASWCELRKKHKATACDVAVEQARKEADKARVSLEEFFTLWISSGYRGFKADWIKPSSQIQSKTTIAPVTPRGPGEYRGQDDKPIPF